MTTRKRAARLRPDTEPGHDSSPERQAHVAAQPRVAEIDDGPLRMIESKELLTRGRGEIERHLGAGGSRGHADAAELSTRGPARFTAAIRAATTPI